jgi:hypothetical protein
MDDSIDIYEKEYEGKFEWRKSRQIFNLKELAEITQSHGVNPISAFPSLFVPSSDNPIGALKYSILMLSHEASECYVLGEFQSCILTCGAIIERVLKLEYLEKNQKMPDEREWTLGRCLYKLNWSGTRITQEIIELGKQILDPRNSRAHALLEHSDPQLSIFGGQERGIEVLSSGHYLIEPYRGDAKMLIETTFKILALLYLKES